MLSSDKFLSKPDINFYKQEQALKVVSQFANYRPEERIKFSHSIFIARTLIFSVDNFLSSTVCALRENFSVRMSHK